MNMLLFFKCFSSAYNEYFHYLNEVFVCDVFYHCCVFRGSALFTYTSIHPVMRLRVSSPFLPHIIKAF